MDTRAIDKAIAELRRQKAQLEQMIGMIELYGEGKRRRGRPPKFLSEALRAAQGTKQNEAGVRGTKKTTRKKSAGRNKRLTLDA